MSAAATATILIGIFGPFIALLFVAYAFYFTRRQGKGEMMVDEEGEPTIFSKVDKCLKVVFFCCTAEDGEGSGEPYEVKEERHYKPKYHKLPV